MSGHLDRVLGHALAAWDAFVSGALDFEALREAIRAAHLALDGAEAKWRGLLEDWSQDLDGVDGRVTGFRSRESLNANVQARFAETAATIRRHLSDRE